MIYVLFVSEQACGRAAAVMGVANGYRGWVGDGLVPFFALTHQNQCSLSQGSEACSTVSSHQREGSMLCLSSSEEVDVVGIDQDKPEDLPPQSIQYQELLELMTRAVAKFKIESPTKKQDYHPKSKLHEHFMQISLIKQGAMPLVEEMLIGCPQSRCLPLRPWYYPPSHLEQPWHSLVRPIQRQVRPVLACTALAAFPLSGQCEPGLKTDRAGLIASGQQHRGQNSTSFPPSGQKLCCASLKPALYTPLRNNVMQPHRFTNKEKLSEN